MHWEIIDVGGREYIRGWIPAFAGMTEGVSRSTLRQAQGERIRLIHAFTATREVESRERVGVGEVVLSSEGWGKKVGQRRRRVYG